jgi:DNA-binding NarL/FixJ family response regulator
MPRVGGIEATKRIVAAAPQCNVLMLTTFAEDENVYGALAAGAVGFLVKDGDPADMIEAVRRAARGEAMLAPSVLARVVERAKRSHDADVAGAGPASEVLARLTARERDVLTLVGAGMSNADIAARLHLGVTTVKTHIVMILDKLNVRNRVQAGVVAHRLGLVDDEFNPR